MIQFIWVSCFFFYLLHFSRKYNQISNDEGTDRIIRMFGLGFFKAINNLQELRFTMWVFNPKKFSNKILSLSHTFLTSFKLVHALQETKMLLKGSGKKFRFIGPSYAFYIWTFMGNFFCGCCLFFCFFVFVILCKTSKQANNFYRSIMVEDDSMELFLVNLSQNVKDLEQLSIFFPR